MSIHLRPADQRWLLLCDREGCGAHIVADPGSHNEQRSQLVTLARELDWRRALDVGDFCPDHAVDLAPELPRDNRCREDAWCISAAGHSGPCVTPGRRAVQVSDFGPGASVRRRWG